MCTGRVCKIENYQMDITTEGGYDEITINGRFYDPQFGYVDLETTTPLRIYAGDEYFDSGQLVVTGADGVVGDPTRVRFTALTSTACQVEADTNGDGIYNHDSRSILWTELG